MARRRVVITGLGAVSSLGMDLASNWDAMLRGESGAGLITRFDTSKHSCKFACEVWGWETEKYFPKIESKKLDKFTMYYLVAAAEAMAASGLDMSKEDRTMAGCILGTGIGGIHEIEASKVLQIERGADRVSPFFIPKIMANAMAGQTAIRFGLQGTCYVTSSACASASHAIGLALRTIQWGEADIMITGGSEAATTELGLAGFCSLKAVSGRNDDPKRASRPFDKNRDGFVMGEGAASLVLEEYEHARRRGAPILAEVLGYGSTDDAFHITAPNEDADGPARAMRMALKDGGISPEQIGYVNAHGTSTYLNDKIETAAIKRVFGDHAKKLAVSSTKSMVGHLLGASGAIELAAATLTLQRGQVHPTINYETPDPECDLDYVPNQAREQRVNYAISNSLGFGGHNTCLLIGKV
ncbi:MAG: beta-ketoacyl-ACP synthase II [Planctomycetes bacterium]|nr:beta-ketoacyl-ACP synthase II [Planctomycetota bacterium]MCC7062455.1 beta-ketoacyl-ACP synthase II [Planctomycetota bacterium]